MAHFHSPRIVTDGLVLCLDAGNPKSYPGSGNIWKDLSGQGNNGTLTNMPTTPFDSGNRGSLVFDGVNDYVNCGNSSILNGSDGKVSVEIICKIDTATAPYTGIITKLNDNSYLGWAIQYVSKSSNIITCRWFGGGENSGLGFNIIQNEITHICCTVTSSGLMKVYLNGNYNVEYQRTVFNLNSTQPLTIGKLNYYNHYLKSNIYGARVYNRALTQQEILQNYNATKGRFGL